MLQPAALLRMFTELALILLGLLLVQVAVSGRLLWNRRSPVWLGLGLFLIYWGVRAWMRRQSNEPRWAAQLRGASLALLGLLMVGMARLPFTWVGPLLGAAGAVLVARGAISVALMARSP